MSYTQLCKLCGRVRTFDNSWSDWMIPKTKPQNAKVVRCFSCDDKLFKENQKKQKDFEDWARGG